MIGSELMSSGVLQTVANLCFAIALCVIAASAVYYASRTDAPMVPMQWGFDGNPTWYAPKFVGLWFVFTTALMLRGIFFVVEHYNEQARVSIWYTLVVVSIGLAVLQFVYLWLVLRTLRQ
jgi:hypothetical protein